MPPPARKFIFRVMHPVMFEAIEHQAIISFPAIGVDGGRAFDLMVNHPDQFGFRAVGHDLGENFARAFKQADDRDFLRGSATPSPTHAAWPEITFINLHDATHKRSRFGSGQSHDALAEQSVKPMRGVWLLLC